MTDTELIILLILASNSQFSCLNLLNAGITGVSTPCSAFPQQKFKGIVPRDLLVKSMNIYTKWPGKMTFQ